MLVTGMDAHNFTLAISHAQAAAIAELLRAVVNAELEVVQELAVEGSARCTALNFQHITPEESLCYAAAFTELIHTYVSQFPGVLNQPPQKKEPPVQESDMSTLVH